MNYQIDEKTYIIDMSCYETEPCCHDITIIDSNGKKIKTVLNGVDIYLLLSESNNEIPKHFKEYKDYKYLGLYD